MKRKQWCTSVGVPSRFNFSRVLFFIEFVTRIVVLDVDVSRDENVKFLLRRHHLLCHPFSQTFLNEIGWYITIVMRKLKTQWIDLTTIEHVPIHYNDSYLLFLNILSIFASSLVSPSRIEYPNLPPDNWCRVRTSSWKIIMIPYD